MFLSIKRCGRCYNGVSTLTNNILASPSSSSSSSSSTTALVKILELHLCCKTNQWNFALVEAHRNFTWNPFQYLFNSRRTPPKESPSLHKVDCTINDTKFDMEQFLRDNEAVEKIWYDILDVLGDKYDFNDSDVNNSAYAESILESTHFTNAFDKLMYVRANNITVPSYVMFDLVYGALLSPKAQELPTLVPPLLRLLRVVLKQQLDELLVTCHTELQASEKRTNDKIIVNKNNDSDEAKDVNIEDAKPLTAAFDNARFQALLNLFDALAEGINQHPAKFVDPDLLATYIDNFKQAFPHTAQTTTFKEFIQRVSTIALKAKLCNTLRELCFAFDPTHCGKVVLNDFRSTLTSVLGKAKADELLHNVTSDGDGMINYNQLIVSLMQSYHIESS